MKSQKSGVSRASRASKTSAMRKSMQNADARSVAASVAASALSGEEQDEWTAIQKFNALLHY